ncbi:MAG: hypothetical protein P1V20_32630 [Verrucomicrobiales bacterium]|nr:hypothetical protein [Verrucomicrobiales bacterium]
MRILNFAILCFCLFCGSTAFSQNYDLATLTTKFGKTYEDIQIINADESGLLFRHSAGIAKENFSQLSANLRDMFEPVDDIPSVTELVGVEEDATPKVEPQIFIPDLTLTMVIRRNPAVCGQNAAFCRMHPNPCNWPSHWSRFHSAHYLTNPICRAAATRQFLQATGLLPRSCGGVFHHSAGPNTIRFH